LRNAAERATERTWVLVVVAIILLTLGTLLAEHRALRDGMLEQRLAICKVQVGVLGRAVAVLLGSAVPPDEHLHTGHSSMYALEFERCRVVVNGLLVLL
jgi:hypothetical protein